MTETESAPTTKATLAEWFQELPATPEQHFRLCFFGTVLGLLHVAATCAESLDQVVERFPFLASYLNPLAEQLDGVAVGEAMDLWWSAVRDWETGAQSHLPLRALREAAGVSHAAMLWLITTGMVEDDPRFGALFESLQAPLRQRRPTVGLLSHCWRDQAQDVTALELLRQLQGSGLVDVLNPEELRQEQVLRVPPVIWDAFRGLPPAAGVEWARYVPPSRLLSMEDLILPAELERTVRTLPSLLGSPETRVVVIRGPGCNGRRTTLGAVARAADRGVLEVAGPPTAEDPRWRQVGLLAVLLHALPVVEFELGPSETARLPDLRPDSVPLGVVLGIHGGLEGSLGTQAMTLHLGMPDVETRARHWERAGLSEDARSLEELSRRWRLAAGRIHHAARLARSQAQLAGRPRLNLEDSLEGSAILNRQALDTLARRVPGGGDWSDLCVGDRTMADLRHLERRCRHRESLPAALGGPHGASLSCGVRALFSGPSGTGKTLAARLLATSLGKDLYQLDLSAVVNKYIGETEKNLNRLFDRAEELDVILLLDEGDALLTRRTEVQTSNDRYANLETNFLLQRLESFQGILMVTTNKRGHIDTAFERRMDVCVEFLQPDAQERWQLWRSHLPGAHAVDDALLEELAGRCEFTGGQIRNAVLHATLLALDHGRVVTSGHLEAAVRHEYQKQGGTCPLLLTGALS